MLTAQLWSILVRCTANDSKLSLCHSATVTLVRFDFPRPVLVFKWVHGCISSNAQQENMSATALMWLIQFAMDPETNSLLDAMQHPFGRV